MKDQNIAEKPMRIEMLGYEVVEKIAKPCSSSSRIYLPVDWREKKVRAVRIE
jgi:hypothetical protein